MKKIFILIGAIIAVVITTTFLYVPRENPSPQITPAFSLASTTTQSSTSTHPVLKPSPSPATTTALATVQATVRVSDKIYTFNVTPNETVMGAMRTLASTTDFRYTSRDYPGLGEFVDSINGIKNTAGLYWILYINGASATSGASAIAVHVNDVIEWKYEKNY